MTGYKRIRLGAGGSELEGCIKGNFAGLDYGIGEDLTGKFGASWKEFNAQFIPVWLQGNPGKSKVAAGLSCGALWTFCHEMAKGDYVLSPNSDMNFHIGQVSGNYLYEPQGPLPHRRPVEWIDKVFTRDSFSEEFQRSVRGPLSNVDVGKYAAEIEQVLGGAQPPVLSATNPDVEDPIVFALERHLEDFLVANWDTTEFGSTHELWKVDGEIAGQQYPTDTGPIDLFAVSKDGNELLVIELKKGRVSDVVVGQIQRYMGFVTSELAEDHQTVRGVIIGLKDDLRLQRALSVTNNIDFYRYKVDFELEKT
jgi:restriction system protein